MLEIWYAHLDTVSNDAFEYLLVSLPETMQHNVSRYNQIADRKRKLIGRLIVQNYFASDKFFSWERWSETERGKPYIQMANRKFSISHSGDYVTVAFSEKEVGIDLEIKEEIVVEDILTSLHHEEIEYVRNAGDKNNAFYYVWTRKEAYLKAIGVGIVEDLSKHNCLREKVVEGTTYYIENLKFKTGYSLAVAHEIPIEKVELKEVTTYIEML
jgi:4'-phosphopantetheinyl transferase